MREDYPDITDDPTDEGDDESTEHTVPNELLDLHVDLDEAGVTPEEFEAAFGKGTA